MGYKKDCIRRDEPCCTYCWRNFPGLHYLQVTLGDKFLDQPWSKIMQSVRQSGMLLDTENFPRWFLLAAG